MKYRTYLILVAVLGLGLAAGIWAESRPNYNLSHEQTLELKAARSEALAAQIVFNQAKSDLDAKMVAYNRACIQIKKDNRLPESAFCDITNPEPNVNKPAPTPAPAPAKK